MHQNVCTKKHVDTLGKEKDAEKQAHREWLIHKQKQSPPNRFAEAHKDTEIHTPTERVVHIDTLTHGLGVTNAHEDINMPKPRGKMQKSMETQGQKNG